FKIVVGGETLSGDAITDLYARIADGRLHNAPAPGRLETREIDDDYVQRVASDIQIDRPLKVVVDAGNGVAGELGPKVLEAIGAEVVPLYCDIDGTFPNHHPDPSEPHNLADLVKMVDRLDADLGIAFDGDGDRLGVVTRDGHNIFPDRLLMLFAADVLERNPGAQIIFDVKCTGRLPGYILRHRGSPLMWKTGHSLIKAKMRETGAELAGEMSGHFFFQERWYGFDDGIYAAARLLEILAARPEAPGEVLAALPAGISTPEIKVVAPGEDPHGFVERFVAAADFSGAPAGPPGGARRGAGGAARRDSAAGDQGRRARGGPARLRRTLRRRRRLQRRPPVDHRRAAGGLAGRLGPGACIQHHAGAGAALRCRRPGGAGPHPGRVPAPAAGAGPGTGAPVLTRAAAARLNGWQRPA